MSTQYVGQITGFGGNFAPREWAFCDGQLLAISQNDALFSLLGTVYGGDGRTTFGLPDLRGREMMHWGSGPGLPPVQLGQQGGTSTITLTANTMPAHTHGVTLHAENADGDVSLPDGQMLARAGADTIYIAPTPQRPNVQMADEAIVEQTIGGNVAFNNHGPWLGIRMIIALTGVYPSRA